MTRMAINRFGMIKILVIAEFVLIAAVIALALISNKEATGYAVKDNPGIENIDFKILTKAVCEEKPEHVFCKDVLFVRCNGNEYFVENLENFTKCGFKLNLSDLKVTGHAILGKTWKDPR